LHFDAEQMIRDCKNGNRQSQQLLYGHCYPGMMKLCMLYCNNRDDASAVFNSAMLKVFNQLHTLKDAATMMGWIRRIVVNTCVDHCRSKAAATLHPVTKTMDNAVLIQPEVYAKISADEVMQLLHQLPVNSAMVFNLFVIEGYRHEEIASIIGIAVGTSKWHLNEARRLLKEKIELLSNKKNYSNAI